jgi:putative transposase
MAEIYQSLSDPNGLQVSCCVLLPKRRRKVIFGQTRRHLGPIFHALARQRSVRLSKDT